MEEDKTILKFSVEGIGVVSLAVTLWKDETVFGGNLLWPLRWRHVHG